MIMPKKLMIENLKHTIFLIQDDKSFHEIAMKVFHYQAVHNKVYQQYISFLGEKPDQIASIEKIPFLPIHFFKQHPVYCSGTCPGFYFESSGTTGDRSKHYVQDISFYEQSFTRAFELFYQSPQEYCILALLPNYLEQSNSSLVYMADKLMKLSGHESSGFYLYDHENLMNQLEKNESLGQKSLLLGVSFALLDLAGQNKTRLDHTIIMETGGMKGRSKEITREELHQVLMDRFQVGAIHSEYGMTELLSQSYSRGGGTYFSPPWKKIMIRDLHDPFSVLGKGKQGGINVIDLANIHSCSFIQTADIGELTSDGGFKVHGRFDHSDVRGCSLMVQ